MFSAAVAVIAVSVGEMSDLNRFFSLFTFSLFITFCHYMSGYEWLVVNRDMVKRTSPARLRHSIGRLQLSDLDISVA